MDNFLEIETSVKRVFNSFRHEVDGILDRKLTGGEFRVLSLISSGINRTTDLSKKLDVSASHITAITDSLVANNFITRHRSEVDRRIVVLELTEEAKDFVASIEQKKKEMIVRRFSVFTEEEREQFQELLKKLAEN
ncbi:MarR family transcriptional regulator [Listeria newyorkensis]|uniref:MarR family transcriptional regulator n=1 Tax=Listeria newyorkensis TaxID=1497681 RepID=A0A841YTM7_9LIST|nr:MULTISPECIES: MarR family transcriptional regulator [Listeria]KGL44907.1 MarR family transcriptional regulator [Listeriaceae bacterium FSL A5-0209]KGL40968.1 MarR family transcriptional regulator [Listeria newyorkensis]KMT61915.1 putative MarR family transcriptional regulator [Listeria newyorkensis]MBC1456123.1 MarR family transcriptional regulator [Listeria newyorkensis]PNP92450.1 MarR family transcriptional regulator [Listeria newyorkensis]